MINYDIFIKNYSKIFYNCVYSFLVRSGIKFPGLLFLLRECIKFSNKVCYIIVYYI